MSLVAEDIKYIAIQGAGGKGAAYLGVLQALEEEGILPNDKNQKTNIKGISGTSTGCITALMVSLGFSSENIKEIAIEKKWFQKVMNESYFKGRYRAYSKKCDGSNDKAIGFFKQKIGRKNKKTDFKDKMTLSDKYINFDDGTVKSMKPILGNLGKTGGALKKYISHYFIDMIIHNIQDFIDGIETTDIKRRINPFTMNVMKEAGLELSRKLEYVSSAVEQITGEKPHYLDDMAQGLKEEPTNEAEAIWFGSFMCVVECIIIPKLSMLVSKQSDGCTISDYEIRKIQEHWDMFKVYIRLFIGVNVGKMGLNIPRTSIRYIDRMIDSIDTLAEWNFKDKHGELSLDPVVAMYELSAIIVEIHVLFSKGGDKYDLKQLLRPIIAPFKALLHDGGILGGARVRYVFATFVYFSVEVAYRKEGENFIVENFNKYKEIKLDNSALIEILDKAKFKKFDDNIVIKAKELIYISQKIMGRNINKGMKYFGVSTAAEAQTLFLEIKTKVDAEFNKEYKKYISISSLEKAKIICIEEELLYIEQHFTFEKHKEIFGIDLVICAANLSNKTSTYFNPSLTPDFPVVEACSLSMSIPGLWKPVAIEYVPSKGKGKLKKVKFNGTGMQLETDTEFYKKNYKGWFVDGGIYENLPLHAFNGYSVLTAKKGKVKKDYTPQELAESISSFPTNEIFGISYKSSHCEFTKAKKDGKNLDEVDYMSMFRFEQKGFMSIFLDILGGLFEYSSELRAINKNQKYSDCIVKANSGYLGMLTFNISNKQMCAFCQNVIKTKKETLKIFGKEMDIDEKKCREECK